MKKFVEPEITVMIFSTEEVMSQRWIEGSGNYGGGEEEDG